jgi:hypothetical protein
VSTSNHVPNSFQAQQKKKRPVTDAMIYDNWIRDVLHNITKPLFLDYVRLWQLVTASSFNLADQTEDDIVWTRTANEIYSDKSAYNMQFDGSMDSSFPVGIWQV